MKKLLISVAVTLLIALALGVALATASEGTDEAESAQFDADAIAGVIQTWRDGCWAPWPGKDLSRMTLTDSAREQISGKFREAVASVGTGEFIDGPCGSADIAYQIEAMRASDPEYVQTGRETKVVAVEFRNTKAGGDLIVWAYVWQGETGIWTGESTSSGRTYEVDAMPVYEYTVRKTDAGWRLVNETLAVVSSDADPAAYGPDTRHDSELVVE